MTIRNRATLERHWRELRAAGIPLDPPEHRCAVQKDVTIRKGENGYTLAEIRELETGALAYIVPTFIRRDNPGKTVVREFWIAPPFPGPVDLLERSFIDTRTDERYYRFARDSERFFTEHVLNHRIDSVLRRGDFLEGSVLGVGPAIPETYQDRAWIEVKVGILDQFDEPFSTTMQLPLRRQSARCEEIKHSTRVPLLSRRDRIVPGNPQMESRIAPASPKADVQKDVAGFVTAMNKLMEAKDRVARCPKSFNAEPSRRDQHSTASLRQLCKRA